METNFMEWVLRFSNLSVTWGANLLAQSGLLAGAGLFVAWILRHKGAPLRSAILRVTLAAILLCPIASLGLKAVGVKGLTFSLPRASTQAPEDYARAAGLDPSYFRPADYSTRSEPEMQRPTLASRSYSEPALTATTETADAPPAVVSRAQRARARNSLATIYITLTVLWLAVLWLLLFRLMTAHVRMSRVRRAANEAPSPLSAMCDALARDMQIRTPALLTSPLVKSPCLIGLLRPAILLPESSDKADHLTSREVILHELAHLARRDCAWNLLGRIARAALFFQPFLWALTRQIQQSSDDVADDYVVRHEVDRRSYAHLLLELAERLQPAPSEALAGMGVIWNKSLLGRRVERILDTTRGISIRIGLLTGIAVLALALCATVAVGLIGVTGTGGTTAREIELVEMAEAHKNASSSHGKLGEWELSLAERSIATDIYRQLVAEFPSRPENRSLLAKSQWDQAEVLWGTGRQEEAFEAAREAEECFQELVYEFPDVAGYRMQLASLKMDMGSLFLVLGMNREAEAADRAAEELLETLSGQSFPLDLSWFYSDRGGILASLGRKEEAEQAYSKALEIAKYFAMEFPFDPEDRSPLAPSYHDLAYRVRWIIEEVQDPEAVEVLRAAVDRCEQVLAAAADDIPPPAKGHWRVSQCIRFLAHRSGEGSEQYVEMMTNALRHAQMAMSSDPARKEYRLHLVDLSREVASVLMASGQEDRAVEVYRQAVPLLEGAVGMAPAAGNELAIVLNCFGRMLEDRGRTEEAEQAYARAESVRERLVAEFPDLPFEYQKSAQGWGGILDYTVRITTPGEYRLYARGAGHDVSSDSFYAWIVGLADGPGGRIPDLCLYHPRVDADFGTDAWLSIAWQEDGLFYADAVWPVQEPGDYTIRVTVRENGTAIDAFAFQLVDLPVPTGYGPEESSVTADGVFVESNGRVAFEAEHFTSRTTSSRPPGGALGGNWLVVPDEDAGHGVRRNVRGTGYVQALPDVYPFT